MKKTSVSKVHVKKYPMKPFHIVQGDIFDAEDVDSRSNYRYVLVFIDVTTGSAYQYFMVSKDQALDGFKAFESWLAMISPQVEEKWGSPVKLTCVAFDLEGSLTTTYGNMQSEADKYFINGGYNRVFTSRGASNSTEKAERYMKSLKAGSINPLLRSSLNPLAFSVKRMAGITTFSLTSTFIKSPSGYS